MNNFHYFVIFILLFKIFTFHYFFYEQFFITIIYYYYFTLLLCMNVLKDKDYQTRKTKMKEEERENSAMYRLQTQT